MSDRQAVSFKSGRWMLKGYLRQPAGDPPFACIVMCHGFTGTMDRLEDVAERFCEAGYAVLTFDYRNFGESEGRPRQVISLERQLEDIAAAVAFARSQPCIDAARIALWGSSLGGGHVVVAAARDGNIAAVISQVPFNGYPRRVEGRSNKDVRKLFSAILKDWVRSKLGLSRHYIPSVGPKGHLAVMASDDAAAAVAALGGDEKSSWQNRVAPAVLLEMMKYKPGNYASAVQAPLLVCIAENDKETPSEFAQELADKAPRGEIRRYPIRHFEIYRPDIREAVTRDQIAFLKSHLQPGT